MVVVLRQARRKSSFRPINVADQSNQNSNFTGGWLSKYPTFIKSLIYRVFVCEFNNLMDFLQSSLLGAGSSQFGGDAFTPSYFELVAEVNEFRVEKGKGLLLKDDLYLV